MTNNKISRKPVEMSIGEVAIKYVTTVRKMVQDQDFVSRIWYKSTVTPYLYPAAGVVLMLLTWPTAAGGRRLLRRWSDVAAPTPDQIAVVVRYLRQRRILAIPLMFVAPLTARGVEVIVGPADDLGMYHLLGALLLAWLVAEALGAAPRPFGLGQATAVRTASLARRDLRGLVPVWAVALHIGLTVVVAVFAALSGRWYLIAVAGLVFVVVYGIGWLAVRRPAAADDRVDGALRMRAARIAVGVGVLVAALLAASGAERLSPVAVWVSVALLVVALVGWSSVIAAPRYG